MEHTFMSFHLREGYDVNGSVRQRQANKHTTYSAENVRVGQHTVSELNAPFGLGWHRAGIPGQRPQGYLDHVRRCSSVLLRTDLSCPAANPTALLSPPLW